MDEGEREGVGVESSRFGVGRREREKWRVRDEAKINVE